MLYNTHCDILSQTTFFSHGIAYPPLYIYIYIPVMLALLCKLSLGYTSVLCTCTYCIIMITQLCSQYTCTIYSCTLKYMIIPVHVPLHVHSTCTCITILIVCTLNYMYMIIPVHLPVHVRSIHYIYVSG